MFRFPWRKSRKGIPAAPPSYWCISDIGCVRETNEDHCICTAPADSNLAKSRGFLAVISDGMGGYTGGAIASRLAAETVADYYMRSVIPPSAALAEAFLKANEIIIETAATNTECDKMGATCTALALVGCYAYSIHIGDSRIYLFREHRFSQLTEDHTGANDKKVLTRVLGRRQNFKISTWDSPFRIYAGDVFLMCTDGLYDLVSDEEIRQCLENLSIGDVCRKLVDLARERGGFDNITIAIIAVPLRPTASRACTSANEGGCA